jgi:hypothetical protein
MLENRALPLEFLPSTGYPARQTLEWMSPDDLIGYHKRKGHPVYGEHDVRYQFNSLGYRCPEFHDEADIRIVVVGCSYVFGLGVAQQDLFHERFAARLRQEFSRSVVLWNLAVSGASNDYMSRLLHLAVPRLDPHIVLINFTHAVRREYVSVDNDYIKYLPALKPTNEVTKEIFRHFAALSSPYDDQLNFFKNYKTVELLLKDRCWLYSNIVWGPTLDHMDLRRYAGVLYPIDRARDGDHPGPESHKALAELYWKKFVEVGDDTALAERLGSPKSTAGDGS